MSFSKQVSQWAGRAEKRAANIFRDSAKDVADLASVPVAKNGRMPVDTGALRASIRVALGSMPSDSSDEVTAGIAKWQPGQTLYIGWTQHYARYMNARFGFMRGAAEKWPAIVKKNAALR